MYVHQFIHFSIETKKIFKLNLRVDGDSNFVLFFVSFIHWNAVHILIFLHQFKYMQLEMGMMDFFTRDCKPFHMEKCNSFGIADAAAIIGLVKMYTLLTNVGVYRNGAFNAHTHTHNVTVSFAK